MRRHPDPEPKGGPPPAPGEVLAAGTAQPARDPQRVYCPACGADITRSCSWSMMPLVGRVAVFTMVPVACPECNHVLRPAPSPLLRPGPIA